MYKATKYYIILLTFIVSCAVIEEPSGGPKDTTPPEISSFSPGNMTTNYDGSSIKLDFTKYMSNAKVVDNITFTPSVKADYSWSGKSLIIEFEEPLRENTTYSMQIGTEYTDWKNNKPAAAFSMIFSTGSKIDSGKIEGELIAEPDRMQGAYIFLYRIDNINPDTLDPSHTQADYKTQIGSNGKFNILALKDGKYRAMAVRDRFKDDLIDLGVDDFGAAIGDIVVEDGKSHPFKILLGPPSDRSGPMLFSAKGVNNRAIEITFNEAINIEALDSSSFTLNAVNTLNYTDVAAIHPLPDNHSKIMIIAESPLDTAFQWEVEASDIFDLAGNMIQDTGKRASFYVYDSRDYPVPAIVKFPFKDSTALKSPTDILSFEFNTAVKQSTSDKKIILIKKSDSSQIDLETYFSPQNVFNISGLSVLEPNQWFTLEIPMQYFESYYGTVPQDTLYRLQFQNYDERDFSNIEGTIDPPDLCENMILILRHDKNEFRVEPDNKGKWNVKLIPPGNYHFEIICDANNNGKYDYGYPFLYEYAENFYVLKDEIKVRAGWDINDLILKVKE